MREFSPPISKYFQIIFATELALRNRQLGASPDPRRRVVRCNFKWTSVDHSLDHINQALCYCCTNTARKIIPGEKHGLHCP